MTLIQELIEIPERVHKGDFVLRLTEGVQRADETLRHYVVTPQLRESFDHAITFIKSAVETRASKAAYLHGSFGSGKSHFMAVLHLLLQHNPDARAIAELAPVVARHDAWLNGKKLLMVPYHMIGAISMESAILGGFVQHVRKHHPKAGIPGVYQAEALFRDAVKLRESIGDYGFFPMLNGPSKVDGEWGDLDVTWNPRQFDEALKQPPGGDLRTALVGDLVKNIFTAQTSLALAKEETHVPLEEGLTIISHFTRELGYDGLILFLDELILWLASHVADLKFVSSEIQKVIKLVESGGSQRPVPIISFVARQRDLRELVGEHMPGAQQLSFADTLKYWEGRFDIITLEDRNLPLIAERRVLKPRSEAARAQLQTAFETSTKVREEILSTLLTSNGDREMFRRVYPFSPALVQALVALSSVLQRERTALKVMIQLLVNQRETLELGQIVPVGDLYDAIADEAEPFTSEMRHHFENARKLYRQKLLPMLEKEHAVRAEDIPDLPVTDARRRAFLADDRLVKTLLLSALVPAVECFKNLNASRLTSLNHGNVRAPIPGQEVGIVLQKCRRWAGQVGEIKIGDEPANPILSVQLTGVDIETILEKARGVDNPGSRAKKIRELLFAALGIPDSDSLFGVEVAHTWRGTSRTMDVVFANIREMIDDATLKAREDRWLFIIDFPFDLEGHSPADDMARINNFQARNNGTQTICWLPSFLSQAVQGELKKLVIMEHVLASDDRFRSFSDHLSEIERASARSLMDNQRSQLKQHVLNCLEGAYGIASAAPGTLDGAHNLADHFQSLDPTFQPRPPVGANLKDGFLHLVEQALGHQFPAHPQFEAELKAANLKRVMDEVTLAIESSDGRVGVEKTQRLLMKQIANPLKLGEMHETHFVLGNHWKTHFERKIAGHSGPASVGNLRRWTDDPKPMGLPAMTQNLLILLFAKQTNRVFMQHGAVVQPSLERIPDEAVLHQQTLPEQSAWERAVKRAGAIFGIAASPLCNATNVVDLAQKIQDQLTTHLDPCRRLVKALGERGQAFSLPGDAARKQSADSMLALLEKLRHADANTLVTILSEWEIPTSEERFGHGLKKASDVLTALNAADWVILEGAWGLTDERQAMAQANRAKVIGALSRDELVVPLGPVLREAKKEAVALLTPAKKPKPPVTPLIDPPIVIPPQPRGRRTFATVSRQGLARAEAKRVLKEIEQQLDKHPHAEMTIEVRIEGEEE
ncbi:MAG: phage resistance protein [Magnetococcales bacterium]|nr:phage resistance protein [Magnetococcales bacterium]